MDTDPYTRPCTFCHAPPGQPCRTILYEEHVEHGNGKEHEQPHAARLNAECQTTVRGSSS